MRFLKTNTATRVTVGPFIDKADGFTPKTALTVTSEKLTLVVDDGGVPTLVLDTAPTASGGNNDMVHITNDDSGYYDLELTAANLNYVGRACLSLNDVATHLPVFHEFMILSAQAYDSLCGTGNLSADVKAINAVSTSSVSTVSAYQGTTQPINFTGTGASAYAKSDVVDIAGAAVSTTTAQLGVNVVQLSADATAADNAESFFDGTGYAGTNNVIPTVTTVTNQLTAAAIATGVWQDATAGDFTTASSIGKALYVANIAPGASGGHMISGTNAGTTTLGALTVTGATTLTGAVTGTNAGNDLRGISVNMIKDQTVTCSTGVTFNANVGTTQPVNFTGTGASAYVKGDVVDIAGAAVSTSTAQLGVNTVSITNNAITANAINTGAITNAKFAAGAIDAAAIADSAIDLATFAADAKTGSALKANVETVTAGAIANASFNDDVNTTAYASNKLALMVFKCLDAALTDATSLTSGGLLDRIRVLGWIMRNKIAVTDANGNTVIYKDDNSTAAFTVNAMLTDDSTTTTRLRAA